jgi:DNA modification methylase
VDLPLNEILVGGALDILQTLPGESVQCAISSPPYWGLRDYNVDPLVFGGDPSCPHEWEDRRYYTEKSAASGGAAEAFSQPGVENAERLKRARWRNDSVCQKCGAWRGQLGLEPSPELYVEHIVEIFREVRRVLRKDGIAWLNLGDCYATGAGKVGDCPGGGEQGARWRGDVDRLRDDKRGYRGDRLANGRNDQDPIQRNKGNRGSAHKMGPITQPNRMPVPGLKAKDLVGIPWRVAFALQADGWWLRMDVVWAKRNCMPESVRDRPTRAHEYLFLLTKAETYYYDADAIREPVACPEDSTAEDAARAFSRLRSLVPQPYQPAARPYGSGNKERFVAEEVGDRGRTNDHIGSSIPWTHDGRGRNKRSVWWIATTPFPEAHFAVFPEDLVAPCVLAGTSERGACADCGAPWERMTERETDNLSNAALAGSEIAGKGHPTSQVRDDHDVRDGPTPSVRTTGWGPGCGCGAPARPCVVLDPFIGSGTTALVALRAGRSFVGIELNPEYAALARRRIAPELSQPRLL